MTEGLPSVYYALRESAKKAGNPVLREKSLEILLSVIREKKPRTVLEIGVNGGLTSAAILLEDYSARLTGIEIDEDAADRAEKNYKTLGVYDRVRIIRADAGEVVPLLCGGYDFIFLDGPKGHYAEYLPYLKNLLNDGGILFADNVLFRGYVEGKVKTPHRFMTIKNRMNEFLKGIQDAPDLKTSVYDIEDGISVSEKIWKR